MRNCHFKEPSNRLLKSTLEAEIHTFLERRLSSREHTQIFETLAAGRQFFNGGDNGDKGSQIRGYGFTHDGSVDTLFRFFQAVVFQFSNGGEGETQRRNVEQFMFAFDSNLKPVVGQQVTLSSTSASDTEDRADLLIARAQAGDAELTVTGVVAGEPRGWLRQANGEFLPDKAPEPALTEAQMLAVASAIGQELTFTAVPNGTGQRIALDRDRDTILNGDDNCVWVPNPEQLDADNDGIGNDCDANQCHPD